MLSLALPLMLAAAPAPADTIDADARCVTTFAYLVGTTKDEGAKTAGVSALIYFVGKLKGADANLSVEAAIRGVAPKMASMQSDLSRCLDEFRAMGTELSAAGAALQAKP